MIENDQKKDTASEKDQNKDQKSHSDVKKEKSIEDKFAESEDKLLRSLAEIENQRRRFEKEIKDAFEFGSFNFAKESLAILDNLQRAKLAIQNDEVLKNNKDLDKFLENLTIIEKDLVSIFEKNRIKKINTKKVELIHTSFSKKINQINFKRIQELRNIFKLPVSYGSHSPYINTIPLSVHYNPSSIFFYIKLNHKMDYPDNNHAVKIKDIKEILNSVDFNHEMIE